MDKKKLTQKESEEILSLYELAKKGDNIAWNNLYSRVEKLIHKIAWKKLNKLSLITDAKRKEWERELFQAGWIGFVEAFNRYDPTIKVKLTTYAFSDINGAMTKELDFLMNTYGVTKDDKNVKLFTLQDVAELPIEKEVKYSEIPRALHIIEVLKMQTDENHSLTQEEIREYLALYRAMVLKTKSRPEADGTMKKTLFDILSAVNPEKYTSKTKDDFRIKYKGYKKNALSDALGKGKGSKRAPIITDFAYIHDFDNASLDKLIQAVALCDFIGPDDKTKLIEKLTDTASIYYKSPYWNNGKITFYPKGLNIKNDTTQPVIAKNLEIIQQAIHEFLQIHFLFGKYNENGEVVPNGTYRHRISPYRIIKYHDNYYLIGFKPTDRRIWHYRVDLLSEIEILKDEEGNAMKIDVDGFYGNPLQTETWNPSRYIAEHLYMGYDEPRDIKIKVHDDDYTMLHDWFGNHYKKTKDSCEEGSMIIQVKTSPGMLVHWAMQYGDRVEVLDEKVRKMILAEINKVGKIYGL